MEQKAEELYEDGWCTSQTTVFSPGPCGFKVDRNRLSSRNNRFQRQFLNQRTQCRQTIMENYNKQSNMVQVSKGTSAIVDVQGQHELKANIDMVRRALEAHPLMIAIDITLCLTCLL